MPWRWPNVDNPSQRYWETGLLSLFLILSNGQLMPKLSYELKSQVRKQKWKRTWKPNGTQSLHGRECESAKLTAFWFTVLELELKAKAWLWSQTEEGLHPVLRIVHEHGEGLLPSQARFPHRKSGLEGDTTGCCDGYSATEEKTYSVSCEQVFR